MILAILGEAEFIPTSLPGVAITKYHTNVGGFKHPISFSLGPGKLEVWTGASLSGSKGKPASSSLFFPCLS